jgi:DNA-binding NarL/FixJ family response regulator
MSAEQATPTEDNSNPWGLTTAQLKAMRAVCTHGCHKLAARELCLSVKTIENHALAAAKKMGIQGTCLSKYLAFDRWMRGNAK